MSLDDRRSRCPLPVSAPTARAIASPQATRHRHWSLEPRTGERHPAQLRGGNHRRFSFVSNGSDNLLCSGQRRVSTFSRGLCLNFGRQYDRFERVVALIDVAFHDVVALEAHPLRFGQRSQLAQRPDGPAPLPWRAKRPAMGSNSTRQRRCFSTHSLVMTFLLPDGQDRPRLASL